ncbi:MAG: helix-turn-helix domain-containing protein [Hyphomicrobiales bacterium]|nr:helix-turn-helix domain-containing protein [Hyphomicrobiales bacterium]MCP4999439.1 helix-turn-helix domain-containing protein [Hyphomicrobiales bacterium]
MMAAGSNVWSTVGSGDAFAHWREVVCQAFTKLSPERTGDHPFAGEIRLSEFGPLGSFSQITASPQLVQRRKRDVNERPCDAVFVNIQISGSSVVRQRGMETRLGPGTFVMLDARQPFDMRFDESFKQVCMHLPMTLLEEHDFDPAGAVARSVGRGQVFGAALLDSVGSILAGEDTEGSPDHPVHLLRLSYENGRSDVLADRRLKHIKQFVGQNCADSTMSPGVVAAHFRISVRHLHKLFARAGVSFGQFLLRCRLRKARIAILLHPRRPILEIGLEAGFQSPGHFARSFSREFGMTPSAMRRLC